MYASVATGAVGEKDSMQEDFVNVDAMPRPNSPTHYWAREG